MIATAWHDAYVPQQRLLLHLIIGTSAAFFRNPALTPPAVGPTEFTLRGESPHSFDDEKHTGVILRSERTLAFDAPVPEPITARDGRLLITPANRRGASYEVKLDFETKTRRLLGKVKLSRDEVRDNQYQLRFCYSDAASGYVYLKSDLQGFVLAERPPVLPASPDPGVLLEGDFTRADVVDLKNLFWLAGSCAGPLGRAPRKGKRTGEGPRPGGLDMNWFDRVWFLPSSYFNQAVCRGMVLRIEAKMTAGFEGNEYCALLTKGSFSTGFRLLVGQDRRVLFQIAGIGPVQGRPLGISSGPGGLPLDRWTRIEVSVLPPGPAGPGTVELRIDGRRVARAAMVRPMPPSAAVMGIGCEFKNPTSGPFGKFRPNFPGLIRRFTVRVPGR